jgi:hypothetical protein
VIISKPFIKFGHLHDTLINNNDSLLLINSSNYSRSNHQNEVDLTVPYWSAGFVAIIFSIFFATAFLFENKNNKNYNSFKMSSFVIEDNEDGGDVDQSDNDISPYRGNIIKIKIIFL